MVPRPSTSTLGPLSSFVPWVRISAFVEIFLILRFFGAALFLCVELAHELVDVVGILEKLLEQKIRLQNLEIILILSAIGFPMQRFLWGLDTGPTQHLTTIFGSGWGWRRPSVQ